MSTFAKKRIFSWFLICVSIGFFIWSGFAYIERTPGGSRVLVEGTVSELHQFPGKNNKYTVALITAYLDNEEIFESVVDEHQKYHFGEKVLLLVNKDNLSKDIYNPFTVWTVPFTIAWIGLAFLLWGAGWLIFWWRIKQQVKNFVEPVEKTTKEDRKYWWVYLLIFFLIYQCGSPIRSITLKSAKDNVAFFSLGIGIILCIAAFFYLWYVYREKYTHIAHATILETIKESEDNKTSSAKASYNVEFTTMAGEKFTQQVKKVFPVGCNGYVRYNPHDFNKIFWVSYASWGAFTLMLWSSLYPLIVSALAFVSKYIP